jgi:hypothetical protein
VTGKLKRRGKKSIGWKHGHESFTARLQSPGTGLADRGFGAVQLSGNFFVRKFLD